MVVQHNMSAINANRYFGINNSKLSKSLEKLSSGYAINRAGDNAAGLAVSEKMRSQIAGINQGVKNAQDGISMVQTYEGALTETDSILQRMKTLATQAANGTYQNEVDREAIQLEFNQLNDELDQIADTDFNGVVALNGGQMADGLKALNGKFDYSNFTREAGQLDKSFVNKIDYSKLDDTDTDKGTVANKLWSSWNTNWDRTNESTNDDGPDYIDFTFTYDEASGDWKHESNSAGISVDNTKDIVQKKTGGFSFGKDGVATDAVNVVIDETALMNGDKITIRVNNPAAGVTKPGNIGVDGTRTSGTLAEGTDTNALKDQNANLGATIETTGTYSEDMQKFVDQLDGATFSASYSSTTVSAATDFKLTLADGTVINSTNLAKKDDKITLKDGTTVTAADGIDWAAGTIKLIVGTDTDNVTVTLQAKTQKDAPDKDKSLSSGTLTYTLGVEHGEYDNSKLPTAEVVEADGAAVSKSNSYSAATAPLTYSNHVVLQTGARTKDSVDFTFKYSSEGIGDLEANLDCSSREGGLNTKNLSLATQEDANAAIDRIDNAINKVSMVRGTFGAVQNRLEHKIDNLNTTSENLTSAESRIRDTNMAEEMMNFTKNQILSQASQSMLAQANQLPQGVLSLLQ